MLYREVLELARSVARPEDAYRVCRRTVGSKGKLVLQLFSRVLFLFAVVLLRRFACVELFIFSRSCCQGCRQQQNVQLLISQVAYSLITQIALGYNLYNSLAVDA